jgi:hypothetical protein
MIDNNILTLFYSEILYLTCYFQIYRVYIITIEIKSKTQPKMHYRIHIYTIIAFAII